MSEGAKISRAMAVLHGLIIAFLAVLLVYGGSKYAFAPADGVSTLFVITPLLGLVLFIGLLQVPDDMRSNVILSTVSLGVCLYLIEIAAVVWGQGTDISQGFKEKSAVMERYRRQGERAFPTSYPETFYDRPVKSTRGPDIFPLGTVSNVVSVFCKEAGELMVYKTDRHGFHNEDSVWDAESKPIVLIGDSFTTGACVASENNIAATLQGLTGEKVLNLGVAGGGPLAYLAVIREYLPGLKLRDVYWIHFEANDLMNVVDEMKNPILRRYTDSEFSQNLKRRQDEIDEGLEIFLNDSYREFGMRIEKDENVSISETLIDSERRAAFFKKYITDVLLLRNTRFLVQTIVGTRFLTAQTNNAEWMYPVANPLPAGGTMTAVDAEKYCGNPSFGLFKDAFDRGLKEVSTLGAKLNFVYIHDVHSGLEGRLDNLQYLCVRQFVESKETLFIDFTDSLIPPDRSRVLYAYPKGGHFSERGYEMAGHTIARSMGSLIHKKPE